MPPLTRTFFYALILVLISSSCTTPRQENQTAEASRFHGTSEAVHRAERMFEAIGGLDAWANVRSLYIKAQHVEPDLDRPYQSEIWRALDTFHMVIEQKNDDFHNRALFTGDSAHIHYVHLDSSRLLSTEALERWKFSHDHNVYVVWHTIGRSNSTNVRIDSLDRLHFMHADESLAAFSLDSIGRPYRFYSRQFDGSFNLSVFPKWSTTNGLTHPSGGGPEDGSFRFDSDVWSPSPLSLDEAFDLPKISK